LAEHTRDIKRRIRSIKNTEQITKAMEMVAAARLRRAQERVESARPYSQKIDELIKRLAGTFSEITHPLFLPRERHNVGYAVFTSDRGLCGAFNSHVIRSSISAPIIFSTSMTPVLVGLIPTLLIMISLPFTRVAATIKKAAAEISPGT
jgi:ATP synthase F1 gamma subunit